MSFDKIISIPGMSGLYQMLAQMRNGGFVVESLSDQRRVPVSAMQRIIMLKDISVYTQDKDIPLREVFLKMKAEDAVASAVSNKAEPEELKATLKKVLPEFDEERVHASDIRKMFMWYNLLKDQVDFTEETPAEETESAEPAAATVTAETDAAEAPKKTARKKKATAETEPTAENAEPAVKKPRTRKTAAKSEE